MEKHNGDNAAKALKIEFDHTSGYLEITGKSIHENSSDFYRPLIEALEVYSFNALPTTSVFIHFKYFSAGSYKCMLNVFRKLVNIKKAGKSVIINWNYEDDFVLEVGEEYQAITNLPFEMIQVPGKYNSRK